MTDIVRPGQSPLYARARYPNQADAEDELTFRKDEILQVIKKDFNGQVDWWLCRLGSNVGMVPANYLEIFHPHAPKTALLASSQQKEKEDSSEKDYDIPKSQPRALKRPPIVTQSPPPNTGGVTLVAGGIPQHEMDSKYADYDFPRARTTSPAAPPTLEEDIYDRPPTDDNEPDYDLPPPEVPPATDTLDIYDRPPSAKSSRSNLSNRVSSTSVGSSTNQIYDVPPVSPSAIYDVPPTDVFGQGGGRGSGEGMDVSAMYENEAEEFLKKSRFDVDKKFDDLWQCVYGNDAYWGSEMKARRRETLQRTVTAAKELDDTLLSLVAFGKGVNMALENSNTKDTNFKKKYQAANTILVNKKKEVLSKIDVLVEADEKDVPVTATVKSLLEGARTIPQAVQAFVILVLANKTILFKTTVKSDELLPVLTKTEVKNRPLPDLPDSTSRPRSKRLDSGSDYADISNAGSDSGGSVSLTTTTLIANSTTTNGSHTGYSSTLDVNSTHGRKRNPHDILPPLPFATLRKPSKKEKTPPASTAHAITCMDGDDYDDIDGDLSPSHVAVVAPPPLPPRADAHLLSVNTGGRTSPNINAARLRGNLSRQSSGGSNSSDGSSSPLRSRSPDVSTPYGYPGRTNGTSVRSGSPPQPLRHEDRELLARYSQQMELLVPGLKDAIQTFLESIRNSEQPKDFVTKSKLAVVAAYKMVYIADSLHQKLRHNDIKAAVVSSNNQLTETIKCLVSDTKTAALQFPNVVSLEKMRESLRSLFPACLDLLTAVKNPKF